MGGDPWAEEAHQGEEAEGQGEAVPAIPALPEVFQGDQDQVHHQAEAEDPLGELVLHLDLGRSDSPEHPDRRGRPDRPEEDGSSGEDQESTAGPGMKEWGPGSSQPLLFS